MITDPVTIDYTNHRGERRKRKIRPIMRSLRFVETEDHVPAQWVFDAFDVERRDAPIRTFALANIHSWEKPE